MAEGDPNAPISQSEVFAQKALTSAPLKSSSHVLSPGEPPVAEAASAGNWPTRLELAEKLLGAYLGLEAGLWRAQVDRWQGTPAWQAAEWLLSEQRIASPQDAAVRSEPVSLEEVGRNLQEVGRNLLAYSEGLAETTGAAGLGSAAKFLFYDNVGHFMHAVTGSDTYRQQAQAANEANRAVDAFLKAGPDTVEAFLKAGPDAALRNLALGLVSGLDELNTSIEQGDTEGAMRGIGKFVGSVGSVAVAPETRGPTAGPRVLAAEGLAIATQKVLATGPAKAQLPPVLAMTKAKGKAEGHSVTTPAPVGPGVPRSILDQTIGQIPELARLWERARTHVGIDPRSIDPTDTEAGRAAYDKVRARFVRELTLQSDDALAGRRVLEEAGFKFLRDEQGRLLQRMPILDLPDVEARIRRGQNSDALGLSGQHGIKVSENAALAIDRHNILLMITRDNKQMDAPTALSVRVRERTIRELLKP